jgi:hypothetical protein
MIAMIEPPFGAPAVPVAGRAHRGLTRRHPTRPRAIGVAAITGGTDRKQPVTASTDLLAKRRVHGVEAAARFDWTRPQNRGTRERTDSVRRSIEAVTEGLERHLQAFTSFRPFARQPTAIPDFGGALGGSCAPALA